MADLEVTVVREFVTGAVAVIDHSDVTDDGERVYAVRAECIVDATGVRTSAHPGDVLRITLAPDSELVAKAVVIRTANAAAPFDSAAAA